MKNRRTIIVAFMLCAIMLLGIGYATVSDALDITGLAEVNGGAVQTAFDAKIYFEKAEVTTGITTGTATPDTALVLSADEASFATYHLAEVGNIAQFTFTIKNDSDLEVEISPVLTYSGDTAAQTTAKEHFDVYSDWREEGNDYPTPRKVAPKTTTTYTVNIKVKKTPAVPEGGLLSCSFHIKLNVNSVDSVTSSD